MQEQKKSSKLEESMKMLDYEMKKTDDLLYRMIPKPVAKRLRKGEPAVNTCEVHKCSQFCPKNSVIETKSMTTSISKTNTTKCSKQQEVAVLGYLRLTYRVKAGLKSSVVL